MVIKLVGISNYFYHFPSNEKFLQYCGLFLINPLELRPPISAGVALDSQAHNGKTPLMLAGQYDHAGVARMLLEQGARAELRTDQGGHITLT